MTKQEYINSLSVDQLRSLVDTFSDMLIDEDQIGYIGEDDEDEDPDGFYCPNSGMNFLDNDED